MTQPPQVWSDDLQSLKWEMDPSPQLARIFAGTARYKLRPWWANSNAVNYMPTSRAPFNPVEKAERSVGLIRGDVPCGYVLDDVRKDDKTRHYQWSAMLNAGVWEAQLGGVPSNMIALGSVQREDDPLSEEPPPLIIPKTGDPILLVVALGMSSSGDKDLPLIAVQRDEGPKDRKGGQLFHNRVVVNQRAASANFRILLLPLRAGDSVPKINYEEDSNSLIWDGGITEMRYPL